MRPSFITHIKRLRDIHEPLASFFVLGEPAAEGALP